MSVLIELVRLDWDELSEAADADLITRQLRDGLDVGSVRLASGGSGGALTALTGDE